MVKTTPGAGSLNPRGGNKFEPTTKAKPPSHPHEHDDNTADSAGPGRPQPK